MHQIIQRCRSFNFGENEFVNRNILKKKTEEIKNSEQQKHTNIHEDQPHHHIAMAELIFDLVNDRTR